MFTLTPVLKGLRFGLVMAVVPLSLLPQSALSQNNAYSPAIVVNDKVVTQFEIDQRMIFLKVIGTQGDVRATALKQLVDERLQSQAAQVAGISVTEEQIAEGVTEFAGRANLSTEALMQVFASEGLARESFEAFVEAGLAWRQLVRQRFTRRISVTEAEVDRAVTAQSTQGSLQVLLSEIIMPFGIFDDPESVMARAEGISNLTSTAAFSEQARQFSATATAADGGRLPWRALSDLPPGLRTVVMALKPGEISDPIELQGAVALFQLRGVTEGSYRAPRVTALDYALYQIPGGRSDGALEVALDLEDRLDRCDDLYGVAKGQPADVLQRETLPPSQVPSDIAFELSKLDEGEVSYALTRDQGETLVFLMLCGRTTQANAEADRSEILRRLREQRIIQVSEAYLSQLRAEARIVEQ